VTVGEYCSYLIVSLLTFIYAPNCVDPIINNDIEPQTTTSFFSPKIYAIRTYMYILYGKLMGVDGSQQRIEFNEIDNRSENDSPYFSRK